MQDIHDIKGLIEILPFWQKYLPFLILLSILLLCAIIFSIYFIIKKLKKSSIPSLESNLSPYEKAIQELIKTKAYMNPGMDKILSIKISDVIRNYLVSAFHLHAYEKTSEEFLYNIQQEMTFSSKPLNTLASFLEMCDLAKFAKIEFTPHDQQTLYEKAHDFLNFAHQEEIQPSTQSENTQTKTQTS